MTTWMGQNDYSCLRDHEKSPNYLARVYSAIYRELTSKPVWKWQGDSKIRRWLANRSDSYRILYS